MASQNLNRLAENARQGGRLRQSFSKWKEITDAKSVGEKISVQHKKQIKKIDTEMQSTTKRIQKLGQQKQDIEQEIEELRQTKKD